MRTMVEDFVRLAVLMLAGAVGMMAVSCELARAESRIVYVIRSRQGKPVDYMFSSRPDACTYRTYAHAGARIVRERWSTTGKNERRTLFVPRRDGVLDRGVILYVRRPDDYEQYWAGKYGYEFFKEVWGRR